MKVQLSLLERQEAVSIVDAMDNYDMQMEIAYELVVLRKIAIAAYASVNNKAWAGVCDEDVILEKMLKRWKNIK